MDQVELIEQFRADLTLRGLSRDTVLQYPWYVRALFEFNDGDLLGVNDKILGRYLYHLKERDLGLPTIKRYFVGLSTFYEFLTYKKYIGANPVTPVRRHYMNAYKNHDASQRRKCISLEEARLLVNSILDPKEKAVTLLLLKTGIRRRELSTLNLSDVDMENMTIRLRPTGKGSNEVVYFDEETAKILNKWLIRRERLNKNKIAALFLDKYGNRLSADAVNHVVTKHAKVTGLHNLKSDQLCDRFGPHACRHWFTTVLIEAGMPREYVKELRGDAKHDAVDIYNHIDRRKLQKSYLDCIPQLGL
jgi:integrase/recombinase XerD